MDHTDIVATSAVREAGNRDEFVEEAWRECRFNVRVIDGNEEAALSYLGVKKGLSLIASPLVVDLGGGSTEFMLENAGGVFALSLPLGAVRATETRMNSDAIRRALAVLNQHKAEWADNPLVFVGGTAATLAAVKLKLREYRSELVHGQMLSCQDVNEIYNKLNSLTLPERRLIPGLQPERADIILPAR
ncbi:Ppx/GppA phosphatase family protein [Syntrophomonas palmitatica]|uniref:Ppx/GppA phosphatase family protein n=1 Tax=Syntrophomonas palmitatica TaxID=402877 RepID=UPI0006D1EC68|nr:hypothetical protein [Syntrophomonas palmitatica]